MTQPSGWYDDPQDPSYLRYFDGVSWTDHRAPKRAPQLDRTTIGEGAHLEDVKRGPADRAQGQGEDRSRSPYVVGSGGSSPQERPAWQQPGQGPGPYGAAPAPTTPDGMPLASWGRRLAAMIIDHLLVTLVALPFVMPLLGGYVDELSTWYDRVLATGSSNSAEWPAAPQPDTTVLMQASLVMLVIFLVYELFCLSRWGRTPGRAMLDISVRAVEAATPAPTTRLLVRALLKRADTIFPFAALGNMFVLVDGLFPLWDRPLRQAIHDKAARTVVVRGKLPPRG